MNVMVVWVVVTLIVFFASAGAAQVIYGDPRRTRRIQPPLWTVAVLGSLVYGSVISGLIWLLVFVWYFVDWS